MASILYRDDVTHFSVNDPLSIEVRSRGSSLRAEAVGMLSISLVIALMAKYSNRTNIKIVYVSDNLELIKRNKEHLNYKNPYPNDTLSLEFDITEQIYLTNQTYQINASFQHVYGHQDTRSRGKMSTKAKLNVEADRLAGLYQDELGAYSPITYSMTSMRGMRNSTASKQQYYYEQ